MDIDERFRAATAAAAAAFPGPELLPERLARASAAVLPVAGAGISLFFAADRRLPLGASDEESAQAERLQFTVGEGPCLSAAASGRPLPADEETIRSCWPVFYDELVARTAIRGTISIPLGDELTGVGALDLYLVPPRDVRAVTLFDALTVAGEVVRALQGNSRAVPGADGPAWLDAPAVGRRSLVWQAMGFVAMGLEVTSPEALDLLRAHAYAESVTLDEIAAQVLDRAVPLELLSPDAEGSR